jgi:WD40 repeat protein
LAIPREASVEIREPLDGTITNVISQGNLSYVFAAAFSPDGERLATAGGTRGYPGYNGVLDYNIYLWYVPDGSLISRMQGHVDEVHALAFSPFTSPSFGGAFAVSRDTSRIAAGSGPIDLWCRTP